MSERSVDEIRKRIDHPVIDGDGHTLEFMPAALEHIADVGGQSAADAFSVMQNIWPYAKKMSVDEQRALGLFRMTWWGFPAANTLDRATATLPRLMYERLDEFGLDYAVLYPTFGLAALNVDDAEVRSASCRGLNRYYKEMYGEFGDRLEAAAVIPMHTPEEACAELDYAVRELGHKVCVLAGFVYRPTVGDNPRVARWVDSFGLDSPYDYDPVWRKCIELGISPTFHSSAMGWFGRQSPSNYVLNHLGNFGAAGEATCRALFMGGVTRRFPALRCGFLEGGVAWASQLYADLIGHYEKRGGRSIDHLDPRKIDWAQLGDLFAKYAPERLAGHAENFEQHFQVLADPAEDEAVIDEFAACEIERAEDIRELFSGPFYFGCEADDPMNRLAFDSRANPFGARLKAVFGSDIGHWDVPDACGVLPEAYELVDEGLITESDFRDFVFANPLGLFAGSNPAFFDGTAVEEDAKAWLQEQPPA